MRIAVDDVAAARGLLAANGVRFTERLGRVVVPAGEACGVAIAFATADALTAKAGPDTPA